MHPSRHPDPDGQGRYSPCGIAFTKDFLFRKGGGPALYVRGDEWDWVADMPAKLRARAVRLWPGATSTDGLPLPWYLVRPSEWIHEREWWIAGEGAPVGVAFASGDVAFVIAPDPRWVEFLASFIGPSPRSTCPTSGRCPLWRCARTAP